MRKASILITGILLAAVVIEGMAYSTEAKNLFSETAYSDPGIIIEDFINGGEVGTVNRLTIVPDHQLVGSRNNYVVKNLGITVSTRAYARNFGVVNGAYVEDISSYSPAKAAHIQKGDLITEVNGFDVKNAEDLLMIMYDTVPGQKIVVTVAQAQEAGHFRYKDIIVRITGEASSK